MERGWLVTINVVFEDYSSNEFRYLLSRRFWLDGAVPCLSVFKSSGIDYPVSGKINW
jgi:hypothetical protein